MQTISLYIQNLLAPCHCRCRYCFLCARGEAGGVPYGRGEALARRIHEALPALPLSYTCGYCYDYPELPRNIAFNRELGFAGAGFLQINGAAMREAGELRAWLETLREAGAASIDATFYGLEATHDAFAARPGDFDYLLRILRAAKELDYEIICTFPVTEENKAETAPLLALLESEGLTRFYGFLPDHRGRGARLEDIRLTRASMEALPENVRQCANLANYKTEAEWLRAGFPAPERRQLRLVLTAEDISHWESLPPSQIVAGLESLDDAYRAALPPMEELAERYGDPGGQRLCQARDLRWKWQSRWLRENDLQVYDVTHENKTGSVWR
ncbi:MAG: hypothetical protein LBB75_09305 [Oscillospiraceae bacterium]|nr:hypothetical protein [Oscillospiraceae bacterium]